MSRKLFLLLTMVLAGATDVAFAVDPKLDPGTAPAPTFKTLDQIPPTWDQLLPGSVRFKVVFSGAGEKAFVSGADISQFEDQRAAKEAVTHYEALAEDALMSIHRFAKPTLACIRGWCIGGGVNVAIGCDIRIAASDAVFGVPAARLGLGYRYSALKNLVDLIGVGATKDLFYTARRIDADEALRLGLVSRTCSVDALPGLLAEYTSSIGENAPLTIRAAKAIVGEILKPSPELDAARCRELILDCFESEDYAEGRRAFMEKRKPRFTGR